LRPTQGADVQADVGVHGRHVHAQIDRAIRRRVLVVTQIRGVRVAIEPPLAWAPTLYVGPDPDACVLVSREQLVDHRADVDRADAGRDFGVTDVVGVRPSELAG